MFDVPQYTKPKFRIIRKYLNFSKTGVEMVGGKCKNNSSQLQEMRDVRIELTTLGYHMLVTWPHVINYETYALPTEPISLDEAKCFQVISCSSYPPIPWYLRGCPYDGVLICSTVVQSAGLTLPTEPIPLNEAICFNWVQKVCRLQHFFTNFYNGTCWKMIQCS